MRSVDDAIGFLAQDPMHATAQAKRHAGQLPAAAEEFIESTLFYKKDDSTKVGLLSGALTIVSVISGPNIFCSVL